ncbi:MAG: hypothetical protein PHW04_05395 [Candidatus Wallbacteria bacterium]|nr:hypothetical protein [Candidatus Wallbacteria bacterium]
MQKAIALMLEVEERARQLSQAAKGNVDYLLDYTRLRIAEMEKKINTETDREIRDLKDLMEHRASRQVSEIRKKSGAKFKLTDAELEELLDLLEKEVFV